MGDVLRKALDWDAGLDDFTTPGRSWCDDSNDILADETPAI
jgi:hypothetical protein